VRRCGTARRSFGSVPAFGRFWSRGRSKQSDKAVTAELDDFRKVGLERRDVRKVGLEQCDGVVRHDARKVGLERRDVRRVGLVRHDVRSEASRRSGGFGLGDGRRGSNSRVGRLSEGWSGTERRLEGWSGQERCNVSSKVSWRLKCYGVGGNPYWY